MWPFSEMSLAGASFWGDVANWTLIVCLVGGVISTFGIVQTANVKERHWDSARDEAKGQIENAKTEAAKAIERTAALNEKAAAAELALAELKWRTAWRHIDEKAFAESLAAYPKPTIPIEILYVSHDANSFMLAKQIFLALGIAGWPALEPGPVPPAPPDRKTLDAMAISGQPLGVTIVTADGTSPFEQKHTARYGLLDAVARQIASVFGAWDRTMPDGAFRIIVAPRPPM